MAQREKTLGTDKISAKIFEFWKTVWILFLREGSPAKHNLTFWPFSHHNFLQKSCQISFIWQHICAHLCLNNKCNPLILLFVAYIAFPWLRNLMSFIWSVGKIVSYCLLKATPKGCSNPPTLFFAEVRGALKDVNDVTLCCPVTEKKGMLSFPPLIPV